MSLAECVVMSPGSKLHWVMAFSGSMGNANSDIGMILIGRVKNAYLSIKPWISKTISTSPRRKAFWKNLLIILVLDFIITEPGVNLRRCLFATLADFFSLLLLLLYSYAWQAICSIAGKSIMVSPCRIVCPDVCPVVPCQHGLVRGAGESIIRMLLRRHHNDRECSLAL